MTPGGSGPLPAVRPDLSSLDGYHSAQVEVEVRLNTNESPLPPPDGWREALLEAVDAIEFNRYPDRAATGLRQALADSAPTLFLSADTEFLRDLKTGPLGAGRK